MTLLRYLWRWLTAPAPTRCRHCGNALTTRQDGSVRGLCKTCEEYE